MGETIPKPFPWSDKFLLVEIFPAMEVVNLTADLLHVRVETLPEYKTS
jgi:hypothetical protein